jgi:hypothetical protein
VLADEGDGARPSGCCRATWRVPRPPSHGGVSRGDPSNGCLQDRGSGPQSPGSRGVLQARSPSAVVRSDLPFELTPRIGWPPGSSNFAGAAFSLSRGKTTSRVGRNAHDTYRLRCDTQRP